MVERSLLKENNIKLHLYHGREISVEGKQYKVTFYHGREISVEGKQYKGTFLSW
jgi:hypothetical protein